MTTQQAIEHGRVSEQGRFIVTRTSARRGVVCYVRLSVCVTTLTRPLPLDVAHYWRKVLATRRDERIRDVLPVNIQRTFEI